MKMNCVLASAVALLSLASSAALASGAPSVMKACAADVQKYCPALPDRHATRKCMRSHLADVSPDCHSAMEAARAARAARRAAAASAHDPSAAPSPANAPH